VTNSVHFEISAREGAARLGRFKLPHGYIDTPTFMPVGTYGTVKALSPEELEALGAQIVLGNTFHLMLRPGPEIVGLHRDGLHGFMGWDRPILTDSGGFQVFSLTKLRQIDEDGVSFRSPVDGASIRMRPEDSMDVQRVLRSDIAMAFDECTAYPATHEQARDSMQRSMRWALRSYDHYYREQPPGHLFGIVQGGMHEPLRVESIQALSQRPFPGYAIGGLAVGEPHRVTCAMTEEAATLLPADRPRYLMGVGKPEQLADYVARGVDMMDCVLPTRSARHGCLFTREGPLLIKNARYARDSRPVDEACGCPVCRRYSRAYLRHLALSNEILGAVLNTQHNVYFYLDLMRQIREAIAAGRLAEFSARLLDQQAAGRA
jgi:queuine tRNA-ribosyltransferase